MTAELTSTSPSGLNELRSVIDNLPAKEKEGINVNNTLGGGVISVVAGGEIILPTAVAIKHTMDTIPMGPIFSPIDARNILYKAPYTQDVDAKILMNLEDNEEINVPNVLRYYQEERITVMNDFTQEGYTLLQDKIVNNEEIHPDAYKNLGRTMAALRAEMPNMGDYVEEVENPVAQIEERTEELRVSLYDGRMEFYNWIWANLLDPDNAEFTWTDGHPKNIAFDENGDNIVFDFGRTINCDPDYVVPNFVAHIYLSILGGSIDKETGMQIIEDVESGYEERLREEEGMESYSLDEQKYAWYTTAEIAHRGKTLRWLDPKLVETVGGERAKAAVDHVIDLVFNTDEPIVSKERFNDVFSQVVDNLHGDEDSFKRPSIN